MCGIVGFFNCGSKDELQNAVKCISHRGPDSSDTEWFTNKNSGLGHTRLSIIDLSDAGKQPKYDRETGNWIIYNGEIYNYKEIRSKLRKKGHQFTSDCDTEVILKAYSEWGQNSVDYLNGMFSFAIYNEKSGHVFACRDRLGIKPFYYYQKDNKLIIASEIKSILECKDYNRAPDLNALHTPVHYQVSPQTGFKGIKKLEPGHYLTFKDSNFNITSYWDIHPTENPISEKGALERLDELLLDSIKLQMVSDVPVGALLSGGLDSSLICVLMQKLMDEPLNTFTIKFKEEDLKRQGNVDDSVYAKRLAELHNFNHHEITIEPDIVDLLPKIIYSLEEPIADPAAINTYLISKEAREAGIKVLLSGMGADEVFSGYRPHLACLKADTYQNIPGPIRSTIESIFNYIPSSNKKRDFKYIRWVKSFFNFASLPRERRALLMKNSALHKKEFQEYFVSNLNYEDSLYIKKGSELFSEHESLSYLTKICYLDTKMYMPDHNLTYLDKAMMAASVEGRPPLIDHRIVEFMFSLPPEFKINGNTQKYLLKKVSEKYLPEDIIYRSKAPFSAPMRGWLKKELKEMVNDVLSYDAVKKRGIYNPEYINQLIERNEKGLEDNSQLIWRLIVNELWLRTFFK
ncbi:asparagine synthase (glutamine-hydrolyzing) [Gracilimonas sp.]|uniref:asparagine synthase (glutamine-hydrolyzing) n=1 Tax=Gracilimonas sp. TaxID=1974203 RepID=UPI003D0C9D7E